MKHFILGVMLLVVVAVMSGCCGYYVAEGPYCGPPYRPPCYLPACNPCDSISDARR